MSRPRMSRAEAARRQRAYEARRKAWAEAVGRREVVLPLAEPGPLRVVETDA